MAEPCDLGVRRSVGIPLGLIYPLALGLLAVSGAACVAVAPRRPEPARAALPHQDLNAIVLEAVGDLPEGGGYGTRAAGQALIDAVHIDSDFRIDPTHAQPSFCSSATYLVLLRTLARLREAGQLPVPLTALQPLAPPTSLDSLFHDDGKGLWGRWNANGPGTAVLFHQVGLGINFTDWSRKRPGDFMKIWWTDAVGKKESGHSVIYLDERVNPQTGTPEVQYFSSGKPGGYGRVWVARAKIVHALFSRLTTPANLVRAASIPEVDGYLASLLTVESSFAEAKQQSGVTE